MPGGLVGELILLTGPDKGMGMFINNGQFYVIGSASSCDMEVPSDGVAGRHCRLMVGSGLITVEDLRSGKDTLINGQKVQVASVSFGDHIRVGHHVLRLDERTDAFAPPKEILELGGTCHDCHGPILVGEFGHPDVYRRSDGRLCAPCAEAKLAAAPEPLPVPVVVEEAQAPAQEEGEPEVIGGRYAIVSRAGSGLLGIVYEAWDARTNNRVAVKLIHRRFRDDPVSFARLRDAGQRSMLLDHPWVARPLRIGDDPAGTYLASEFVEGTAIWKRIDAEGAFDVDLAIRLGLALADALDLIHVKGLIHGDLKPSNLLAVPEDRVKITDVGLARACLGTGPGLVDSGLPARTLAFHAPELLAAEMEADVRSDVYSLGAVLYCFLTGVPPFEGSDSVELVNRIVCEEPIGVRERRPEVPEALAAVVARAMAKDPEARYPSASEMGSSLMEAWM
ncbi:MAG: protein kinase [Planctomycetes bacterium]|nr:protein kinase [Planctomycetota bacterium]